VRVLLFALVVFAIGAGYSAFMVWLQNRNADD
jgi:hypothetical protein